MAVGVSNFDDSDFEEYNPHPYRGGYDISLTYGEPLPPSSAICYPLSGASSPPPPPQVTAEPLTNGEPKPVPPEAEERAIPSSFVPDADKLPYEYGSSNDYIERGYDLRDWWSRFAGFSPFILAEDGNGHGGRRSYDAEELKFWSRWRRAADFIFGYPQGYGERKIGVDSYGVPIYAYKCNGFDALQMQLEPARTEKIDFHSGFLDPESVRLIT
ncbi:Uncharacterized protein AXF42_Ash008847 [Apostasia shenzhenica]|uniref:Uncharacterized protein n=1 Tax=Apostasia shenzhenica TaxID=1088818 RepID=A0A2I0ASN9_9ASPA|nr:Uncharacterized protein AXF42_Ash008847 [Apostasia shenzhenica]